MKPLKVLLGCEESQAVCLAFRKLGHEAYSNDIIECSGGHPEQKKTCLWLKKLPLIKSTNNVKEHMMTLPLKERTRIHWLGSNHGRERSVTYQGIALAMATQWSEYLERLEK